MSEYEYDYGADQQEVDVEYVEETQQEDHPVEESQADLVDDPEDEDEDDEEDDEPTFQFTISDPAKSYNGKKLSFWVYKIASEVTIHGDYQQSDFSVRRRFSHFLWLRNHLVSENPGCIVPPVPEKDFKGTLEKFVSSVDTKGLLEYRQRSLTKFLTRVGEHYILNKSEQLRQFLTEEFSDFNQTVKNNPPKKPSSMSTWFKKSLTHQLVWITQQKKFVNDLEESLKQLKVKLTEMVKRRKDMSGAIADFGSAFHVLGNVEKMYEDSALSTSLIEMSKKAEQLAIGALSQAERETMQVIETLTYYLGMCDAIKKIIKCLEDLRLEKDDATHALRQNKEKVAKAQKSGKEDKIASAEEKVASTQARLKEAEDTLTKATENFKNDIDRFDMERKVDFQFMLRAFVALQIEYSNELRKSWETLLPSISTIQPV